MTDKHQLRRQLRARRHAFVAALAVPVRDRLAEAAIDRIDALVGGAECVAAYLAFGSEIDIAPALARAWARGQQTALPHISERDAPMRFLAWRPGDSLEKGPFGLLQPRADAPEASPDLILAPVLGFDRRMRRIGQGAGFYDRAFAALPAARRIGVAWSVQEADAIPTDPWDVPLHAIVTEQELIAEL